MYTDDWFLYTFDVSFIEKALNSNHLSLKHVFKQLSTDWLDVTEIDSPYYWYKNINFQHDLDSLKMQINE